MTKPDSSFISLRTLNSLVKQVLEDNFLEDVWVVAEIADLKVASSGHCYLELVEKSHERIVARMKANIWSRQYQEILSVFLLETGKTLERGVSVLMRAAVGFHEIYGMSLTVKEIDPRYTMGEMARKRNEVITRLKREALIDLNKSLELTLVPKRIAVVSSKTAAGFEDFIHQLNHNLHQYVVECQLFEATLQGERAVDSLLEALEAVKSNMAHFDALVIIRGGGASLDLSVFDEWEIAAAVAQFPLPVICGIGHERDQSVVDLVANLSFKTPTAVAAFILQQFEEFEEQVQEASSALQAAIRMQLLDKNRQLDQLGVLFSKRVNRYVNGQRKELAEVRNALVHKSFSIFSKGKQKLGTNKIQLLNNSVMKTKDFKYQLTRKVEELERFSKQRIHTQLEQLKVMAEQVKWMDPQKVLERGYALIRDEDNVVIKSKKKIKPDQSLNVQMKDGKFAVKASEI